MFSPDPSVPIASGTIVIPRAAERGRKVEMKDISDRRQPARKRSVSLGKRQEKEAVSAQQVEVEKVAEAKGKEKEREKKPEAPTTEQAPQPVSFVFSFK
jgi:hypothetical protein